MKILKKSKQEQGITLIALVVTIIVLLILAGVTISAVMGENGLFQKASAARDINERENIKEDVTLAWGSIQMEGLPNNTSLADKAAQLETELKKKDASATVTVSTEDANVLEVSYKGYSINLNASNDTVTYIAKNGTSGGNNNNNNENNNNNNNNNNTVPDPGIYNMSTGEKIAAINTSATKDSTDDSGDVYNLSNGLSYVIKETNGWITTYQDDNEESIQVIGNNVFMRLRETEDGSEWKSDSEMELPEYKFVVPSNIENICYDAFRFRDKMSYLVLPDSIKKFSWASIYLNTHVFEEDSNGDSIYNGKKGWWTMTNTQHEMDLEIGSSIENFYDEDDGYVKDLNHGLAHIYLRSVTQTSWITLKESLNKLQIPGTTIRFMGTEQQFLAATGFSSLSQATTGLNSKYTLEMTE